MTHDWQVAFSTIEPPPSLSACDCLSLFPPITVSSCSVLAPCLSMSGQGADYVCLLSSRQQESVFQQPRQTERHKETHFRGDAKPVHIVTRVYSHASGTVYHLQINRKWVQLGRICQKFCMYLAINQLDSALDEKSEDYQSDYNSFCGEQWGCVCQIVVEMFNKKPQTDMMVLEKKLGHTLPNKP